MTLPPMNLKERMKPAAREQSDGVFPANSLRAIWRWLLLAFAVCCLLLGIVGVFVPGLPTTVFILMSAWAASRSSPRFLAWLEAHRLFGPSLRNWRAGRYVSRRAKISAALTMALSSALLFWMQPHPWLAEGVTVFMASVLVWLWLRPEPPAD
ncbi:YbaN family protein [Uliginosibacterium sp. H1]|uniref:YbaN family protein n=1 Tax=Uliginosibacterium sp. H1 TaxID=3114757 RepID=UPI002E16EABE|nr:YbaN family protein [Uliginosibacterium sp. H1]